MTPDHHRLRFHTWLVESGLDADTADAILMAMSPFDWHELATKKDLEQFATKADLEQMRNEMATKADLEQVRPEMATKTDLEWFASRDDVVSLRTEMNGGFSQLRHEMEGLRRDVRLTLLAVIGFMLSILLTAGGAAITLAT